MNLTVLSDMFVCKIRGFIHKNQNQFIFSLISYMFRPDLLSTCRESYGVTFQIRGIFRLPEVPNKPGRNMLQI